MISEKTATIQSAKHDREHPYTYVSKALIDDKTISLLLKGLLLWCLGRVSTWRIQISHMSNELGESKKSIYKLLQEGIKSGYITRTQDRIGSRFTNVQYFVHEEKIQIILPLSQNGHAENGRAQNGQDSKEQEYSLQEYSEVKNENIVKVDAHSAANAASELCEYFLSSIKKKESTFKQPNLKAWTSEMDKLLRRDKRDLEEAKALIDFVRSSSSHPFIMSPKSFREKYDQQREFMKVNVLETNKTENRQRFLTQQTLAKQAKSKILQDFAFDKDHVISLKNGSKVSLALSPENFESNMRDLLNGNLS